MSEQQTNSSGPRVREWKRDFSRAAAGGIGGVAALAVAGWPDDTALGAWVVVAGGVVGLAIEVAAEYVLRLRAEVHRLQGIERQNEAERAQRVEERKLWDHQVQLANRKAAVAEVGTKVWGGVVREAIESGKPIPPDAIAVILARQQAELQAKNIDKPLPPPD